MKDPNRWQSIRAGESGKALQYLQEELEEGRDITLSAEMYFTEVFRDDPESSRAARALRRKYRPQEYAD